MKTILKWLGIILFAGVLVFMGSCALQNCRAKKTETGPTAPSVKQAAYEIKIKVTGRLFYSSNVVNFTPQAKVGERRFAMQGYYEAEGGKYVFRNILMTLDERIFGEIIVRKR